MATCGGGLGGGAAVTIGRQTSSSPAAGSRLKIRGGPSVVPPSPARSAFGVGVLGTYRIEIRLSPRPSST
ncbi:hypothetical protein QC762_0086580 [Podospora pseudocomata]|uniref:Uncharacterized protein n=1 Tax=Podospora pseudocomata TaxID=2093779 RepID=A0ABR0GDK9_9PEZI|nr:hypothetical protein QC762_0086580 [Podospora pseudocomata]